MLEQITYLLANFPSQFLTAADILNITRLCLYYEPRDLYELFDLTDAYSKPIVLPGLQSTMRTLNF